MLLQAYLASPRARRVLAARPGEAGFSLIELVVVIAILGILIAIALPNFLNVRKDAQISQAKNALATIVKECAVSEAREKGTAIADAKSSSANLGKYKIWEVTGITSASAITWGNQYVVGTAPTTNNTCLTVGARYTVDSGSGVAVSMDLPSFAISSDLASGDTSKACLVDATKYTEGCTRPNNTGTVGTW